MNEKPFFSVIVPCYNVENYLKVCVDSILQQSYRQFELILADDGSTDASRRICEFYAENDNRITVIHQENGGVSVARNAGLDRATGEWIVFIDPDDWIEPSTLEKLHAAISQTEADIYFFDYYQEYAGKRVDKHLLDKSGTIGTDFAKAIKFSPFNQFIIKGKIIEYETNVVWNKVYNADILKRSSLRFLPEARKGQDVIFNAEAFHLFKRFYYIHETLYHYRYLKSSITNRYNPKVRYYNEVAFCEQEKIIHKYNLPQEYNDHLQARILTRLYSCFRLYYFHEEQNIPWRMIKKELREILSSEPYYTAMSTVKSQYLYGGLRIFVICLKNESFTILKFLVSFRAFLQKIRGKNLG